VEGGQINASRGAVASNGALEIETNDVMWGGFGAARFPRISSQTDSKA
jgi:hypothetical protein